MSANTNQPDWDTLAEKFDVFLPQLAPVGEALLEALDARPGEKILDVASGTGEPALSLARRQPKLMINGVDAAAGMVRVAQKKVAAEGLGNLSFSTMPAEHLGYADNTFDRVLSRFGVMLFEDPLRGCQEMQRVLKPGSRIALAVWSTPETMTTLQWAMQVFKDRVPEEHQPPMDKVTLLGQPGVFDTLLRRAGFIAVKVKPVRFDYHYRDFKDYWQSMEASDILKQQFDALPPGQRDNVRDDFAALARDYQTGEGLVIPHEFLLAVGSK